MALQLLISINIYSEIISANPLQVDREKQKCFLLIGFQKIQVICCGNKDEADCMNNCTDLKKASFVLNSKKQTLMKGS